MATSETDVCCASKESPVQHVGSNLIGYWKPFRCWRSLLFLAGAILLAGVVAWAVNVTAVHKTQRFAARSAIVYPLPLTNAVIFSESVTPYPALIASKIFPTLLLSETSHEISLHSGNFKDFITNAASSLPKMQDGAEGAAWTHVVFCLKVRLGEQDCYGIQPLGCDTITVTLSREEIEQAPNKITLITKTTSTPSSHPTKADRDRGLLVSLADSHHCELHFHKTWWGVQAKAVWDGEKPKEYTASDMGGDVELAVQWSLSVQPISKRQGKTDFGLSQEIAKSNDWNIINVVTVVSD